MRKVLCVLSSVMVLASAGSAFAQDVRYNFDREADFTKFKTYKWVTIKDAPKLSDLVDKQIKQTVEAELVKKGLTKTEADTAVATAMREPKPRPQDVERFTYAPSPVDAVYPEDYTGLPAI